MVTKTIVENALIIASEGFWILSSSSQLKRLVITKNRKGLSAPNQTLNAAGNIAWMSYFLTRHLYVPVVTNFTMFFLTTAILFFTLGNRKQFARGLLAILIIGPVTTYILLNYTAISGWVGALYNFVALLPWLVHVIITKKTSGISEKSLFFVYGALACTLLYSILIVSFPLLTASVVGLGTTSILASYYYRYRSDDKKPKKRKLAPAR